MKKALSLFLALVLCLSLSLPALAAAPTDADQENAAWTLYHMGLFQGTDTDKEGFPVFSLSDAPTRAQGVTMLVRLLGQEKAALEGTWTTPFTDVPEWAQPYVGYAYDKGLTNGTGETTFSADKTLSATEYLTLVLRALGYDSASDFAWDSAWTLTDKLGITNQVYSAATTTFLRGDVAWVSAQALRAKEKGSDKTLSATEYLTLVLRALGYDSTSDFAWDSAWTLTDKLGITKQVYSTATTTFLRGDVAWVSAQALSAKEKGSDKTLADTLAAQGIRDNNSRCVWKEDCVTVQKDKLVFSFAATKDSKETYTNFEVTSATANGVACKIEQYSTPAKVKEQCRKISRREDVTVTLPDAFALVYLSYDEAAAKDAATETVTAHQGTYPVITLKLHCTGTLKDGTKVTELVSMNYYVDNYTGYY